MDGLEVKPVEGDVYELGKRIAHAHPGMHDLHHDIGAMRVVCSNGMVALDPGKHYSQTHGEPLNYARFEHAYDGIVNGSEDVEERILPAREQELVNRDEALLVLTDIGIGGYLTPNDPIATLRNALKTELADDQDRPTLLDTYNAMTRALTPSSGITTESRDRWLERAARLLDRHGDVPEAETLGCGAVFVTLTPRYALSDLHVIATERAAPSPNHSRPVWKRGWDHWR